MHHGQTAPAVIHYKETQWPRLTSIYMPKTMYLLKKSGILLKYCQIFSPCNIPVKGKKDERSKDTFPSEIQTKQNIRKPPNFIFYF